MRLLAGSLLPAACFVGSIALAARVRRRAALLAPVLGIAISVSAGSLLASLLSPFGAVSAGPVAVGLSAFAVGSAAVGRPVRSVARRTWWSLRALGPVPLAILGALGATTLVSALGWAPNNWDSMTYRLARIAHWTQHRSTAPYATAISRQNDYPPGAEHLLLHLQVLADSDRAAALLQWTAWAACSLAAAPLARIWGAPRRWAPWAAVLVASLPMAVLQASSTQNDLVSAAVSTALVTAAVPFFHPRARWRGADAALAGACGAAALLVKPSAAICAAPAVLLAAATVALAWRRRLLGARRVVAAASLAVAVLGAVYAPVRIQRGPVGGSDLATWLYVGTGDLSDRAVNVARGLARHLPVEALDRFLAPPRATTGCGAPGRLCLRGAWRAHEDYAGNPVHAGLVLAAFGGCAIAGRRVRRVSRVGLGLALAAWISFHLVFRDNVWLSRLQLPLFVLAAPAALAVLTRAGLTIRGRLLVAASLALALGSGLRAAAANELRPPAAVLDLPTGAASAYYAALPRLRGPHAAVLRALADLRCTRLGLRIGGDSYDYPLTWRAMHAGAEVRHVLVPDDWPCVLFAEGEPPPRPDGDPWQAVAPGTFVPASRLRGHVRGH